MKTTKKLLCVLLAALMLATAAPIAFAVSVTYTIQDGVLTVNGSGAMDNYNTTEPEWREKANEITSIVIGDGITYVGAYAFKDMVNVTTVSVPASVTSFGAYAFSGCKALKTVSLPAKSTEVERGVFSDCSALTSITIPETVETIRSYAFSNTGLTEIFLPLSVKLIEKFAFSGCSALKKITIKNTKCNIVSGSLPPATPEGSEEEPVTIYAVYNSTGDNYAIANKYAFVRIPDEDKPDYGTPETIQEVVQVSKEELKDTSIGAFFRRIIELLTPNKKEEESTEVFDPIVVTGPGADIGRFILKSPFGTVIMRLRELFKASFVSGLKDML